MLGRGVLRRALEEHIFLDLQHVRLQNQDEARDLLFKKVRFVQKCTKKQKGR